MILQQNERAFLEEVLRGTRGYRENLGNSSGTLLIDVEDFNLSLQGVVIDAAHFNKMEGAIYDTMLMALMQSLGGCRPEELIPSTKLIEEALQRILDWDKAAS